MHIARNLTFASAMIVALFAAVPSNAVERCGVRMEVLVDGRAVPEHRARGKRYVRAIRNQEYAIRLSNDTSGRVAVALSVDGLNTIDAKHTTAKDATKWVLDPHETIVVQGWQVNSEQARSFFFTTERRSYGEWLGDTRNLGVISAVAFAEHRRPVAVAPATDPMAEPWYHRWGFGDGEVRADEAASASGDAVSGARSGVGTAAPKSRRRAVPRDEAATGIGRRVGNDVQWIDVRLDPEPLAELDLRYGFRDELVVLGVLPKPDLERPITRREGAGGFAPDPG